MGIYSRNSNLNYQQKAIVHQKEESEKQRKKEYEESKSEKTKGELIMMKIEQMANEITKVLEGMNLKSGISYTSDTITVDLYKNDYDYSRVNLKLLENITAEQYVATVLHAIKEESENVIEYKASATEKFIIDLIKKYKAEDFIHIADGSIWGDFTNQYIPLNIIKEIYYKEDDCILILIEHDGDEMYRHEIDFYDRTVKLIDVIEKQRAIGALDGLERLALNYSNQD